MAPLQRLLLRTDRQLDKLWHFLLRIKLVSPITLSLFPFRMYLPLAPLVSLFP